MFSVHTNAITKAAVIALCASISFIQPTSYGQTAALSGPIKHGTMPDTTFYSHIFRHLLYLETSSVAPTVANQTPELVASFYTVRLGTSQDENKTLLAAAHSWKTKIDPLDAKAHDLIVSIRARTPGGRLAANQTPPEIPQELLDLQRQRNALTLGQIALLRQRLGEKRFLQIDSLAKRATHVSFKSPKPIQAESMDSSHQ